jgi:hypothetical protein
MNGTEIALAIATGWVALCAFALALALVARRSDEQSCELADVAAEALERRRSSRLPVREEDAAIAAAARRTAARLAQELSRSG